MKTLSSNSSCTTSSCRNRSRLTNPLFSLAQLNWIPKWNNLYHYESIQSKENKLQNKSLDFWIRLSWLNVWGLKFHARFRECDSSFIFRGRWDLLLHLLIHNDQGGEGSIPFTFHNLTFCRLCEKSERTCSGDTSDTSTVSLNNHTRVRYESDTSRIIWLVSCGNSPVAI